MNDLIRDRDERTRRRKKTKRKMDSIIGLSYHDKEHNAASMSFDATKLASDTIRLLDEGYFDNGFVIKKGTLEKYLNGENQYVRGWEYGEDGWTQTDVLNLTEDFVGTVNLGHMDFSTFPFIIGEWRKSDLSLVETENDRKGLDVDLHLDEESVFVKELKRQPYDIGISSEFWYHVNEEDTKSLSEMLGYYMPVIDEVFIFAYGLVGECGNVNSSGLELALDKGEIEMQKELTNEVLEEQIEVAEEALDETLDAVEEIVEDVVENPVEPMEESAEVEEVEETEEVEQAEEVEENLGEEVEGEEVAEEELDYDEAEDDEADEMELALAAVNTLRESVSALTKQVALLTSQINELTEANEQLKKTNRRLQSKLQTEKEKKERFIESTKDLSVQLLPNEEVKPKKEKSSLNDYIYGDGIGEL